MDKEDRLQSAILEIKGKFRARLADQEDQITRYLVKAKGQPESIEPLSKIADIVHKVGGLAKVVGYPDLGNAALTLDAEINAFSPLSSNLAERADLLERTAEFTRLCRTTLKGK